MATTVTPVAGYKHIQVWDIAFDVQDAVINHSMGSDLLKVTIIPFGTRALAVPGVTFTDTNTMTLATPGGDTFRVFIETVSNL